MHGLQIPFNVPSELLATISYLPIALFAESFRVNGALVHAIGRPQPTPIPLTGCVKDIGRLWNMKQNDLFESSDFLVVSRRHGNSFHLANSDLLLESQIVGRTCEVWPASINNHRPTILHVTFFLPESNRSAKRAQVFAWFALSFNILLLAMLAIIQFMNELPTGGSLMVCLILNLSIQVGLHVFTKITVGKEHDVVQDRKKTVEHGAATDVHIVGRNFNKTEFDVLVGYSSQLHAFSNIAIRVQHWKAVRWAFRVLVVNLTVQAALLASLFGKTERQVLGSLVWLVCYVVLHLPRLLMVWWYPHLDLRGQLGRTRKVAPLFFSSRRAALAFIMTIPMTDPKVGQWDWLDEFMPPNERRKRWEHEVTTSELLSSRYAEVGNVVEKQTRLLIAEVKAGQKLKSYRDALNLFKVETRLKTGFSVRHG